MERDRIRNEKRLLTRDLIFHKVTSHRSFDAECGWRGDSKTSYASTSPSSVEGRFESQNRQDREAYSGTNGKSTIRHSGHLQRGLARCDPKSARIRHQVPHVGICGGGNRYRRRRATSCVRRRSGWACEPNYGEAAMSKPRRRLLRVEKCRQCGRRMRRTMLDRYQYKESGLPNVYLYRIVVYECKCGEQVLELPKLVTLHSLIVSKLLMKPARLSGEELRFIRKFAGLRAVDVARMVSVDPVTVSNWERGANQIGEISDKLIRLSVALKLAEFHKKQAKAAHQKVADAYLDLLSEINALPTRETDSQTVDITSDELNNPPLVFEPVQAPAVELAS